MSSNAFGIIPKTPAAVAKAIVYIALAAVGILTTALADDVLTSLELIQTGIIVAGAIPVYLLAGTVAKTISAFAVALGQAVVLLIADGTALADVSIASWLGVVVAAFAAIGVAVVPNKDDDKAVSVVNVYSSFDESATAAAASDAIKHTLR